MEFPVYFHIGSLKLHPHVVMEAVAYSVGFYLVLLRRLKNVPDASGLTPSQRSSVAVGALVGALSGAKLLVAFHHANVLIEDWRMYLLVVLQGKTIVGALLGGLAGVETTKRMIGVRRSTGDSFVYSVLWGMVIGRVGCFLTGLSDRTYGIATTLPWGVDFGDGILRHPTQLYEIVFLLLVFLVLKWLEQQPRKDGDLFKFYMIAYLSFRFLIDFIKPEFRLLLGMSAIQIACLGGLAYYFSISRKRLVRRL